MKRYKVKIYLLLLFPLSLLLNYIASLNPNFIEKYYSSKINRFTIEVISSITNFIPFSLYEITVISAIIGFIVYLIYTLIEIIKETPSQFIPRSDSLSKLQILNQRFRISLKFKYPNHRFGFSIKERRAHKNKFINFLLNCFVVLSISYFLFIILWGLNYNRVPLDESMGMNNKKYTVKELGELYEYLIDKTNLLREEITVDDNNIATVEGGYKSVLKRATLGYDIASKEYETLEGSFGTPKKLLLSEFFNYTGITGIYFPYSGQSGVNVNAPLMTIPATTIHEMAHQRGYAREDEANFIAFLVSAMHPDKDFQYSGYILALSYTGSALYEADLELYETLSLKKSENVERDRLYRIEFWDKYSGKIEELSSKVNDTYLKSNGVSDGEKSYGRMVDLLLNYYMEYIK
ncbi:MAG: DUF3810 domain-containing protein [Clostridium sp.]|uniref:DUF3810 domain-containing protein n=1 Tax=Clostridium sp. TaxID=1506 RepID=UPI00305434E0